MADHVVVRRWLVDLGKLTAARSSHDEAADFIDMGTPMLAMRFPNEAFNAVSLEAVASECKYLPTYGELVSHLRDWWRHHRPSQPAIASPPIPQREPPTEDEIAYVHQRVSEMVTALRSSIQPLADRPSGSRYLSREQLGRAYREAGIVAPNVP